MHIYVIIRRSLRNINTMGARLDFDPQVQAKATYILIHLLLITGPECFWIEVYSDIV